MVSEPVAGLMSEEMTRSGLLSQVMNLSQPDKVALVEYLNKDLDNETPFPVDVRGSIKLSSRMRADVLKAERALEEGKCFTEADILKRFAKWL